MLGERFYTGHSHTENVNRVHVDLILLTDILFSTAGN